MRGLTLAALALGLLGAAALSGCGTPTERPKMSWDLHDGGAEGLALVLGRPGTDDARVVMTCRPHTGAVTLTIVGRRGDTAVAELHSGKLVKRYIGAGHIDDVVPGSLDVAFPLDANDDPVLARMADTGELWILFSYRRLVMPNAFGPAHDFVVGCRRG